MEPGPAHAGEKGPAPGLAAGVRNGGRSAELHDRGAVPARTRSLGVGRGGRGAPQRDGPGLGRCRIAGRVAAGVRRGPTGAERDGQSHRRRARPRGGRPAEGRPNRGRAVLVWRAGDVVGRRGARGAAAARRRSAALARRSVVARSGRRVAGTARAARGQDRDATGAGDIGRRDGDGIAFPDPRRPGRRAGPGEHRRGGRSALRLPAGPRHPRRRHTAPGGRARMARDVGRAGP